MILLITAQHIVQLEMLSQPKKILVFLQVANSILFDADQKGNGRFFPPRKAGHV